MLCYRKPTTDNRQPLTDNRKPFRLLLAATVLVTVADIESTQRCLHRGTCREGNPLLTGQRGRAYAVQVPFLLAAAWSAHRLSHGPPRRRWLWPLPLAALVAVHAVATAMNERF